MTDDRGHLQPVQRTDSTGRTQRRWIRDTAPNKAAMAALSGSAPSVASQPGLRPCHTADWNGISSDEAAGLMKDLVEHSGSPDTLWDDMASATAALTSSNREAAYHATSGHLKEFSSGLRRGWYRLHGLKPSAEASAVTGAGGYEDYSKAFDAVRAAHAAVGREFPSEQAVPAPSDTPQRTDWDTLGEDEVRGILNAAAAKSEDPATIWDNIDLMTEALESKHAKVALEVDRDFTTRTQFRRMWNRVQEELLVRSEDLDSLGGQWAARMHRYVEARKAAAQK